MRFTERTPIEAGFAEVFETRIAPDLDRLETERKDREAAGERGYSVAMLVTFLAGGLTFVSLWQATGEFAGPATFAVLVLGAGTFIAMMLRGGQRLSWDRKVNEAVMPVVMEFLGGLQHSRNAREGFPVKHMARLGLLVSHHGADFQDRLDGVWNGVPFAVVETTLSRITAGDSGHERVFHGLLFHVALPGPAPCPILITRNFDDLPDTAEDLVSGLDTHGLPRIDTGHTSFARHFHLHAEDAEAVRAYLPPAFLDNLVALGTEEAGRGEVHMRAAFDEDSFWLVLGRKRPFLEFATLDLPVEEIAETLHAVFDDIALLRRIIDRLTG
jgi:hypothetical protein